MRHVTPPEAPTTLPRKKPQPLPVGASFRGDLSAPPRRVRGLVYNRAITIRTRIPVKKTSIESFRIAYRLARRDNFAASQRLEGILTPATQGSPFPTADKTQLRKKYIGLKARG